MIITARAENYAIYAMTGAFAGLMAGILGIGGGMIIVPALVYIFHHTQIIPSSMEMHVAAGSSFAIMLFTGQASVRAHYRQGAVLWHVYGLLWPTLVIGAISGALLAARLPTHWLKIIFGIVLLGIGINMLLKIKVSRPHNLPPTWINRLIGFIIGFKSGLLGIGGGAVIVPYLSYYGVDTRKIPGVSALCTFTVAAIGTVTVMYTGHNLVGLPAYTTGFIYWPAVLWVAIPSVLFAPIGARLTYIMPVDELKYGFVAILILAAVSLIF